MIKNWCLIFFACLMFSCENESEKLIIGDWISVEEKRIDDSLPPPPEPIFGRIYNYEFSNDGKCDFRPGFFDFEKFYDGHREFLPYLGTETKYTISGNSIKIFDPVKKEWNNLKIKSITKDTLVMGLDSTWTTYVKKHHKLEAIPDFDAVVVSASPCYGRCPVNDISIGNNGNVVYRGRSFNSKNGCYTSKITNEEFGKIVRQFKKADYIHLKKHYYTMVTDNPTISVVFIKDGEIVKSVSDYASSSPLEFQWAYTPLIYYSQRLKLKPEDETSCFQLDFISYFKTKDSSLQLTDAEAFFLMNKLKSGHESNNKFREIYSLHFGENEKVSKVTTDGRYYKFYFKDKSSKIIDIGFDFLNTKNLVYQFEKYE